MERKDFLSVELPPVRFKRLVAAGLNQADMMGPIALFTLFETVEGEEWKDAAQAWLTDPWIRSLLGAVMVAITEAAITSRYSPWLRVSIWHITDPELGEVPQIDLAVLDTETGRWISLTGATAANEFIREAIREKASREDELTPEEEERLREIFGKEGSDEEE